MRAMHHPKTVVFPIWSVMPDQIHIHRPRAGLAVVNDSVWWSSPSVVRLTSMITDALRLLNDHARVSRVGLHATIERVDSKEALLRLSSSDEPSWTN